MACPLRRAAVACTLLICASIADAQDLPTAPAGREVAIALDSGLIAASGPKQAIIFSQEVRSPGAAWLRPHFSLAVLPGSARVVVTALLDGERQSLDAAGLAMWSLSTAYFNGEAVRVEIVATAADGPCRIAMDHAEAGLEEPMRGVPGQCGICGSDDRTPVSDDSAGRLMSIGCTGTVICQDSTVISAGHCASSGLVMQFRVPASSGNCALSNPPVDDQFPVVSFTNLNSGVGADWSVMVLGTNGVGQRPFQRYGAMKPLAGSPAAAGAPASVRGFGIDATCTLSQTLQQSLGAISSAAATYYTFDCDIRGGNSGSSLVAGGAVVGVVTHCSGSCPNYGTRIDRPDFAAAIAAAMTCDSAFPLTVQSGPAGGVSIAVTPADGGGQMGGITPFGRSYGAYTNVTLTAPATMPGRCFSSWSISGAIGVPSGRSVTITMTAGATATANFVACCPADCDGDGLFTPSDVACFISAWNGGVASQTLSGDFDGNGAVNPADVSAFVAAWLGAVAAGHC